MNPLVYHDQLVMMTVGPEAKASFDLMRQVSPAIFIPSDVIHSEMEGTEGITVVSGSEKDCSRDVTAHYGRKGALIKKVRYNCYSRILLGNISFGNISGKMVSDRNLIELEANKRGADKLQVLPPTISAAGADSSK